METSSSIQSYKELCIIYHFPCYDGAYGAINTYLYYNNFPKNKYKITFMPLRNIYPIFSEINKIYDKIVTLDLAIKDEDIKFLTDKKNDNVSIIIFDHHVSWHEKYEKEYKTIINNHKKIKLIYDQQNIKSACGLSFDFFKKKALNKKDIDKNKVEAIFSEHLEKTNNYIEDADTGRFIINNIHEFKSALANEYSLQLTDLNEKTSQRIKMFLEINPSFLCKIGEKMLKKIKKQAKNVLKQNKIYIVELKGGYKFLICMTEQKYVRNYACPFLAKISKKKGFLPIGGFVYKYVNPLYKFSMRTGDDTCDVAKIAGMYGGGGHKTAAAFTIEYKGIEKLILKEINIYDDIDKTPM